MAITKVDGVTQTKEQVYKRETIRTENFTIKQIDQQIADLRARIDKLNAEKSEALGIKE
jgi:hypothetical protein